MNRGSRATPILDTNAVMLAFFYAIKSALTEFDARQKNVMQARAKLPYMEQPLDAALWWNRRQQLLGGLSELELEQKIAELEAPMREANEQILTFDKGTQTEEKKGRKRK